MYDGVAVATDAPPDDVECQSIVWPAPALAEIVTGPAPHLEPPVPVGALGNGFTTRVIEQELWHPLAFAMVTL